MVEQLKCKPLKGLTSTAQDDTKQNASERINLQHIMELREAFEQADTDQGGSLDLDEVRKSQI
jgi:Ca2+-binding EF-hand superfamily protein